MLKFTDTKVVFSEIPGEITLAINISGCPCHCEGCHSSYLAEDIGEELSAFNLLKIIAKNYGITCIAFMGGDADPYTINRLGSFVHTRFLKAAWYSGRQELSPEVDLQNFDFIKLGPYIKKLGPLNNPTTNQRFYAIHDNKMEDITSEFWKKRI